MRPGAGPQPALEARTALWVSVVAAIVLVIATANVVNLFLARSFRRRRETVVRLALGVSRGRLVMQAMTESLVLSVMGAGAALLIAQWAGAAIRTLLVMARAPSPSVFTDPRTVGLTTALAAAAGILVGLATAMSADRGDLSQTLRGGARGGVAERTRLRAGLLITQAALSVALLIGAALFVRSVERVKSMPIGYDADRVLLVNRVIQRDGFNDSTQRLLRLRLLETARVLPDVESAAWMSSAPFVSTSSTRLYVLGIDSVDALGSFSYQATTPDYFRTMGTRILRGRPLMPEDRAGAPNAAVVSESMARTLWPGQDALGKCFRMREATAPCLTVVGAAGGVALAVVSARWLQPVLFQQSATDPWICAGASAAMTVVALVASVIPAIRASRADPITALGTE